MAVVQLTQGVHALALPVTALPSGQPCGVTIKLTSDAGGATVVATGTEATFTSTGSSQGVSPTVSVPAGGPYYVYILGRMNGVQVAYAAQTNTVMCPTFDIGQGSWS